MTDTSMLVANIVVSVDGSPISDALRSQMVTIDVESSLALPDSIVVGFIDSARTVITDGGFELGSDFSVAVAYGSDATVTLAAGEITSLEAQYGIDGHITIVRALDKSNRMFRGRSTNSWQQSAASDAVSDLASQNGLSTGQIDPTTTTYPVLVQGDQSDWDFLQQLARESGRIAYSQQGMLNFVKPPTTDTAPEPGTLDGPSEPLQLVLGLNVHRLNIAVTAGEQVTSVQVRGWDPGNKQAIVGEGDAGTTMAHNAESPDELASTFGGKTYVVTDIPVNDQSSADGAAKSLAERLSSSFVEADGETYGMPELLAGTAVSLSLVGEPFNGKYVVTTARHTYDYVNGYCTSFTISGPRDSTLGGLASANWSAKLRRLVNGVCTATVSSTQDPNSSGMVQLTFPWLDDTYVSDWCRVMQPGAGSSWGTILLPEVNSEVLVAFDQGDLRRPYVIGGLYNGQDTMSPQADELVDDGSGAINERQMMSRVGHYLLFNDTSGSEAITLQTGDGNHQLILNQGSTTVTLSSTGSVTISGSSITISAQQSLTLNGGSSLTITSPQITISASAQLTISSGGTASLTASGPLSLSGAMTSINS